MRRCARQVVLFAVLATALAGCRALRGPTRPVPLPPDTSPDALIDADDPAESLNPLSADELSGAAEKIRESRRAAKKDGKRYEILLLSGGAVYGAYSAGVLAGWTQTGTRPQFDVVTGISTGALIAPLAFLGPEYDPVIRSRYTGVRNEDLFTIRKQLRGLFFESVADVSPFREKLYETINRQVIAAVAAEHAKGRRCYVGTTNLDTKRLIVWDLGAIAARAGREPDGACRQAAEDLFREAIIASASIPGFFPSVRFQVLIDNAVYEEMHVDGGITQSMFFRPPHVEPSQREAFGPQSLAGSNLYMLVAGKLYADPEGVRPRTVSVVGAAASALLYASGRQDLFRFYLLSILTGMNYYYAAIPADFKTTGSSTNFDPVEMQKLYDEGYRRGLDGVTKRPAGKGKGAKAEVGMAWQTLPPGLQPGEELRSRTGLRLAVRREPRDQPAQPPSGDSPGGGGPTTPPAGPPPVAK
jgi:hypothetical protein